MWPLRQHPTRHNITTLTTPTLLVSFTIPMRR